MLGGGTSPNVASCCSQGCCFQFRMGSRLEGAGCNFVQRRPRTCEFSVGRQPTAVHGRGRECTDTRGRGVLVRFGWTYVVKTWCCSSGCVTATYRCADCSGFRAQGATWQAVLVLCSWHAGSAGHQRAAEPFCAITQRHRNIRMRFTWHDCIQHESAAATRRQGHAHAQADRHRSSDTYR